MIASGEKKEEYREIKKSWQRKLHTCAINSYAGKVGDCQEVIDNEVVWSFPCHKCEYSEKVKFDNINFFNGWAFSEKYPNFKIEVKGIRIDYGRPEWGAEPGVKYFVISLGEIIKEGK